MKKFSKVFEDFQDEDGSSVDYKEVLGELKEMVESTIENAGGEYQTFIDSFMKTPEDFQIEGLINDSDIYDFYLKYRNQIDEILNSVKFYQTPPEDSNIFGLYDFTIKGTMKAVEEFVKKL